MSVSNRETAKTALVSMHHHETDWYEMPGRSEVTVSAWQQVHRQSLPGEEFSVPASVA